MIDIGKRLAYGQLATRCKMVIYKVETASTGRNDFIFDIWLWHGDLYRVSPFQVYRTSTSCLQCDLEFFMFAVMKTFVTVISASTGNKSPCQSHISNIKSFLPVEAEMSVMKV
jgi:hypothetical protein